MVFRKRCNLASSWRNMKRQFFAIREVFFQKRWTWRFDIADHKVQPMRRRRKAQKSRPLLLSTSKTQINGCCFSGSCEDCFASIYVSMLLWGELQIHNLNEKMWRVMTWKRITLAEKCIFCNWDLSTPARGWVLDIQALPYQRASTARAWLPCLRSS